MTKAAVDEITHDAVTLALAKKESAHHYEGVEELYEIMRQKPLTVKAYQINDNNAPSPSSANVKVCHLLRHGQGFHNLMADMYAAQGKNWTQFVGDENNPYVLPEICDAPLTQKGRNQARAVQPIIKDLPSQPELVVLSSQCRALCTGLIAFEHLVGKVPFIAHENVREQTGVHVCDMRRGKSQQILDFPHVDFSLIEHEEDQLFLNDRRETKIEVGERIHDFLTWLEARDETHVAITSHSGWLMTLFNGTVECDDTLKEWFQTGELRSVILEFNKV